MTVIAVSCSTVQVMPPPLEKPEPRAEREVVSWEITPAPGFSDEFGYVRLDFLPPDSGRDLPPGGRLSVHLGRHSLDHANTVWYRFAVVEGSTTLVRVSGKEGIPNIKGPDGNWWSDLALDIPAPFSRELHVMVQDEKTGLVYTFTLRRLVRHIQDDG